MQKVVDLRLIEAAKLSEEQKTCTDVLRVIALQERRDRLVDGVTQEMGKLTYLCRPWNFTPVK